MKTYTFKQLVQELAEVKTKEDLDKWFYQKMDQSFQRDKIGPKDYQTFETLYKNIYNMINSPVNG